MQITATPVVNPANMSDFKKAFRRKQTMLLSIAYFNPAGATQNSEIKI
jgi:hypothetical protein